MTELQQAMIHEQGSSTQGQKHGVKQRDAGEFKGLP